MFVSHPIDGAIYVARHRQRGGKILIWTRVPVAPGPETGVLPDHRDLRVHALKKCGLATLTGMLASHLVGAPEVGLPLLGGPRRPQRKPRAPTSSRRSETK
jgi:hypothetical protein